MADHGSQLIRPRAPSSGDVLHVTRSASVQFVEPIMFRVIRSLDWPTYDGWAWLDGYELNAAMDAVARRSIFVLIEGLRAMRISRPTPPTSANAAASRPTPGPATSAAVRRPGSAQYNKIGRLV